MRRLVLAAAPLALLAGCGAGSAAPAAESASASVGAPPADGGSYASAGDLLAALGKADLPCAGASPVANATAPGATSMIDCGLAPGSSGDTVLVAFDNHAHAQGYAESMTAMATANLMGAVSVVFGENWAVNTTPKYGDQVKLALGGSVLWASPSPSS